jgi:hypothetical protein
MREGATDKDLLDFIHTAWSGRTNRYSEKRLEAINSGKYHPSSRKKMEMISLGG